MVRSHARRSGISSVDDLESESVSTGEVSSVQLAGTEQHPSLKSAYDALPASGGQIYITADVAETESWVDDKPVAVFGGGTDFRDSPPTTVDLAGHTLTLSGGFVHYNAVDFANGSVVIDNKVSEGAGDGYHVDISVRDSPDTAITVGGGLQTGKFDLKANGAAGDGIVFDHDGNDYFNSNRAALEATNNGGRGIVITENAGSSNGIVGNKLFISSEANIGDNLVLGEQVFIGTTFLGYGAEDNEIVWQNWQGQSRENTWNLSNHIARATLRTETQTIPGSATDYVPTFSEDTDLGGTFDPATSTYTTPTPGDYEFKLMLSLGTDTSSGDRYFLRAQINGSEWPVGSKDFIAAGGDDSIEWTPTIELDGGDEVQFTVENKQTSDRSLQGQGYMTVDRT